MSSSSGKIKCPDCDMLIQRKNISKHYNKKHPTLDHYERMKETREIKIRKPRFEFRRSWVIGVIAVVVAFILMGVGGLFLFSVLHENDNGLPNPRTMFFAASDGAVINGTWYSSSHEGAQTIYLIHDIGGDRTDWGDYPQELQKEGYNILTIDLRGHGESTKSIKTEDRTYDWTTMGHLDFMEIANDVKAAYGWVHGELGGEPNTDASPDGAFIGIGKGGLYAFQKYSRMSHERIMSGTIVSLTLDCYGLDVEQAFEDWGDVRPILLAASEGDGTAELAMNTILTRMEEDGEKNGQGVFVAGSQVGIPLMSNPDMRAAILITLDKGWDLSV